MSENLPQLPMVLMPPTSDVKGRCCQVLRPQGVHIDTVSEMLSYLVYLFTMFHFDVKMLMPKSSSIIHSSLERDCGTVAVSVCT